jgi:hypothetical protein
MSLLIYPITEKVTGDLLYASGPRTVAGLTSVAAGKFLQAGGVGAAPIWSTATLPSTATGTGTILRADGTNWVASTNTYPDTITSTHILRGTATNTIGADAELTYDSATGTHTVLKAHNAVTQGFITNTTSGPAAYARSGASNSTVNMFVAACSAAFTTAGIFVADAGVLTSTVNTAGINIGTYTNTQLSFWTNNTERMRIINTGAVGIGMTPVNILDITQSTNGNLLVKALNSNSGVSAGCFYFASNGTANSYFGGRGTTYTTSGLLVANDTEIYSDAVNGIRILSANASGTIIFATAGTAAANERVRILSTGEFLVGKTAVGSAEIVGIGKNQNGGTYTLINNTTSGTAAYTGYYAATGAAFAGNYVGLIQLSAGFTTTGIFVASTATCYTNSTAGFHVGNYGNGPLSLWTNNTKRIEISADGTTCTYGVGGVGTINHGLVINGGSTGLAYFSTQQNSSTKAIFGTANAASALINGSVNTDLCICNTQKILFSADAGVTANMALLTTGEFLIGATAVTSAEQMLLRKDTNGQARFVVANNTSGTAAHANVVVTTSSTQADYAGFAVFSAGYTTSGIGIASTAALYTNMSAGMNVGTTSNTQLALWTNNTQKVSIPAAGGLVIGTGALATTATDGFLYIPTCAGTPTGVPTTQTGTVAMIFDTTNNKLYIYDGGWLGGTTPGAFT